MSTTESDKAATRRLVAYIEEHLRAGSKAGLTFIDPRDYRGRVTRRQNHVIYGRRGAGKSSLIRATKGEQGCWVRVDMENYKDISFPNILIQVLRRILLDLSSQLYNESPWWTGKLRYFSLRRKLSDAARDLKNLMEEPDELQEHRVEKYGGGSEVTGKVGAAPADLAARVGATHDIQVSKTVAKDKLAQLRTQMPEFKELFTEVGTALGGTSVFIVLDDFYFVSKSIQASFLDYLHRLTKETDLFLKVATIKHRSRIYRRIDGTPVGCEVNNDIFVIDMDYTLDRFDDLRSFMGQLLEGAAVEAAVDTDVNRVFAGNGFRTLCLASGGVPRDFLSLFVRLGNKVASGEIPSIGTVEVREAAIENYQTKFSAFREDSATEREALEEYLRIMKQEVYTHKRTNIFLVAKEEIDLFPHEAQALRELVDLRFLHLVDGNTSSAPSDGRRYEAYMLDVSLYDNSRPRNFEEIEPGATDDRSRRDRIRAAPRLDLAAVRRDFQDSGVEIELELTSPA